MMPDQDRRSTGQARRMLREAVKKKRQYTLPPKLHPEKARKKCAVSGKIKWLTELDAKLAICNRDICRGSNSVRNGHSHHEIRVYECPDCNHWHTTHIREHKERVELPPIPKRDLSALQRVVAATRGTDDQNGGVHDQRTEAAVSGGDPQELAC